MEFLTKLKADDVFVALSAISAFFAAVAAWFSFKVSRESLRFQKKLASNQVVSVQLNSVLSLLINVRLVLSDVYGSPDEEFSSVESTFREFKKQIKAISYQTQLPPELLMLKEKTTVAQLTDHEIETAISSIQEKIEALWG
ncbi:hypothetical protein U2G71_004205 [Vibrio vulnificus]|uniref:hypothetical protein n=1 Tax=Vibrio parahaemolyticus TaxID=670 RepID=UPI001DE8CE3F|nr:hypothetical protein [Vibrio parahaemolyticus]EGR0671428.1 hypothetical protein [Vibrio vulnificus]EJO9874827.1 hypothetical protein [Vibrio vulnificus]EMA2414847.1 hypothetical protein [Vibrio vulnificus]MCR9510527.1 hypothetical protein [Vibrio parahaemolyticus]MCS0120877.1 hypothetical protein [Vibrio parahaemolyticus]